MIHAGMRRVAQRERVGPPKVIVVLVERGEWMCYDATFDSDGNWTSTGWIPASVGWNTDEQFVWGVAPELTKVFAHTNAGWVAAREYGMSLDANTYSYDIVTRVVE